MEQQQRGIRRGKGGGSGFTLIEILIVILIIGLLLAVALPNFLKARERSYANTCQANLRTIQAAKEQWQDEVKAAKTATPAWSDLVGPSKYIQSMPICPAGGTYDPHQVVDDATCSQTTLPGHLLP
jgi:prepilin-type N-terminal cleavage/methylation domain-containing protein